MISRAVAQDEISGLVRQDHCK